jgi:hypothetical protein
MPATTKVLIADLLESPAWAVEAGLTALRWNRTDPAHPNRDGGRDGCDAAVPDLSPSSGDTP